MFDELTSRLDQVFRNLRGVGKLSESNIRESLQEIRRVLLDADVNLQVVRDFLARVEEKAVGQEVMKSVLPAQLVVKIVHDELVDAARREGSRLTTASQPPTVYMVVGLQGSGKTTFCRQAGAVSEDQGQAAAAGRGRPCSAPRRRISCRCWAIRSACRCSAAKARTRWRCAKRR